MYRNKTDFLRDMHHPNDRGYDVAVDLLTYCIVKAALEFFRNPREHGLDLIRPIPLAQSPVWTHPMMTYKTEYSQYALPGKRLFGHCLTSLRPTFARTNTIQVIQNSGPIVDVGRADPARADRKTSFVIGPCSHNSSNFIVSIDIPNIVYVLISCGMDQASTCKSIQAEFDDVGIVEPNVDVTADPMDFFYSWVHRMDRITTDVPRRLHLCSRSHDIRLSRLVILQRV
jgi:hypothetical protein